MIEKSEWVYRPKREILFNCISEPLPVIPTIEDLLRGISARDIKKRTQLINKRNMLESKRRNLISKVKKEQHILDTQGCRTIFIESVDTVRVDYTYVLEA